MAQQNTLQQIFDYAYPANHLLRISVVKDTSMTGAKSPYFALISLMPGIIDQNTGSRTYDSQSKITMKQSILHLLTIAKYLRRLCNQQNQALIGNTSFMTDASRSAFGGSDQKMLFISRQADKNNNMIISIGLKIGQSPAKAINISPGLAEALADVIEMMAHETIQLELKESAERAANYRQQQMQNQGQINNQPQPQNPPFVNNNTNFNQAPPPPADNNAGNAMVNNFQNTLNNQQSQQQPNNSTPPPFTGGGNAEVIDPPF